MSGQSKFSTTSSTNANQVIGGCRGGVSGTCPPFWVRCGVKNDMKSQQKKGHFGEALFLTTSHLVVLVMI